MGQLDLLSWQPPVATVIRMPASHYGPQVWRGKVGPVAARIVKMKPGSKSKATLWESEVRSIEADLLCSGATDEEILSEIGRFRQAVVAELARLHHKSERKGPGAA